MPLRVCKCFWEVDGSIPADNIRFLEPRLATASWKEARPCFAPAVALYVKAAVYSNLGRPMIILEPVSKVFCNIEFIAEVRTWIQNEPAHLAIAER